MTYWSFINPLQDIKRVPDVIIRKYSHGRIRAALFGGAFLDAVAP
jgi:hypothetical protein